MSSVRSSLIKLFHNLVDTCPKVTSETAHSVCFAHVKQALQQGGGGGFDDHVVQLFHHYVFIALCECRGITPLESIPLENRK